MEQTTALRKIAKLRKKIRCIQGGQGAGKTIAIGILIANYVSSKPRKEVYIVSHELSKMRDTVLKDFIKILDAFNVPCTVTGQISGQPRIDFPNKSFVRFIGLDKEDVGKGLRSDLVYINEADKITFNAYKEVTSRTNNVYIDFNPNAKFWVHEEIITRSDCDFIKLTFLDNEYLGQSERDEILLYKEKGYHEDGSIKSRYWANQWRVYGLGEIGIIDGAVFEDWEIIDALPTEARLLGFGLDFGWEVPAAMIGVYEWNGTYVLDQVIYERKLTNQDIAEMICEMRLDRELIYADSAEPKSIDEISRFGVNIHPCDGKQDIRPFAIKKIQQKTFYITKQSEGIIDEFRNLVWATDAKGIPTGRPKKGNDHGVDAVIYFIGTIDKYDGKY